ncbi:Isochorismatase-like protein [Aspergillus spectabilis]
MQHPSTQSYIRSGFANRIGWGHRPALLLIDICKAYYTKDSPLSLLGNPAAEAAPDCMRRLLSAAREGGVPVIWSQVYYTEPDMADAGLFWHKAKVLDVWQAGDERGLAGDLEGLEPAVGDVVVVKKLRALNVDTLVLCGVSTSGCVRATALDAMQHGFRPMVVGTACGDRTPEIQQANLFDLDSKYADVVTEQDAVQRLMQPW